MAMGKSLTNDLIELASVTDRQAWSEEKL